VGELPAEVSCSVLYDGDVVQDPAGRCLTVLQQWHGRDGVVSRCVTGAFRLSDAGSGFGYSGPLMEFQGPDRLILTGSLDTEDGLSLKPLPGQPTVDRRLSARSVAQVGEGDLVIAADGLAYRIVNGPRGLEFQKTWCGGQSSKFIGQQVGSYLEHVLPPQLGFVVISQ